MMFFSAVIGSQRSIFYRHCEETAPFMNVPDDHDHKGCRGNLLVKRAQLFESHPNFQRGDCHGFGC